ncbi:MAG: [FeFe] hydrogenase H-cluster maturation GTPase HydF [Verrucomicrobiae bacterium]|nr:[FeFe] hydrogenase H-cluster maturation GTPase HydF [Verrucomicrobiae bacterium]
MNTAPKSLRLQIGLFGRTNVGKSSVLNYLAGQDVAVISDLPGTTTDVVEKAMELLPIGPVLFLDTAGVDDMSALAGARLDKTRRVFDRADVGVLVVEPDIWGGDEEQILEEAVRRKLPVMVVANKADEKMPAESFLAGIEARGLRRPVVVSTRDTKGREHFLTEFKEALLAVLPEENRREPPLLGDLVPAGGWIVMVVPIDLQAPKGRLILPQVQAIRDALDHDAVVAVVKEREYARALAQLRERPALAVCDSQVVLKMVADTPPEIACTTFSILLARLKGDLTELARGAAAIERLRPGDRVLIAEACSHHAAEDDIGRVKIPRWLRQYAGGELNCEVCSGRDYPDSLADYRLVIHCGACMLNRREMLSRMRLAREAGVPVTNYGLCIAETQGVIKRVLSPFPAALEAYQGAQIS